jgi:RNA polymerase sigma-70 factor (ECF subfamily)
MAAEHDPDARLMLRVQEGDRAAFEALVEKYQQPVMNLVYRMLGDLHEAEDLCQNVFVQVYKSAGRYRVTARFSTWLFTIARNLCLNELRRRSRHPAESLDAGPAEQEDYSLHHQIQDATTTAPPEACLHAELEQRIQQALADLPENQRTAILLCRQEELSYEDIAQILHCSVSATKSLIHRARQTLRQRLKPYLRTGHWHDHLPPPDPPP